VIVVAICGPFLLVCLVAVCIGIFQTKSTVSASAVSPDGGYRVSIVERPGRVSRPDRNFDIWLETLSAKPPSRTHVFTSPDEDSPPGSERFMWSKDGHRFALLGRKFHVDEKYKCASGQYLYFVYDIHTGEFWCNGSQSKEPRFPCEDLKAKGFEE
jgi:hypothetical protein